MELAIDPVYEPASFARVDAGTTGNFVSDLIGARSLGVSGSNNQRMNFRNNASTPIDINFTFKNVKKYIGANTILVMPEMYVSHTSLTIGTYLWNYNTSQ